MLNRLIKLTTTPKTRFDVGNVRNDKQAAAATRVNEMQQEVKDIGVAMSQIDETPKDLNSGNPGKVYGKVMAGRRHYNGLAELDESKNVKTLDVNDGHLEVKTDGDRQEIHRTSWLKGTPLAGDLGPNTLVTEEWAVVDGNNGSYKTIEYWKDT
jgi:hypothetical protein